MAVTALNNGAAQVDKRGHERHLPSNASSRQPDQFEVIDAEELARRWSVPESWVREQTRARAADPLPHVRLGRYVRFEWGSPPLIKWWGHRRSRNQKSFP